MSKKFYQTEAFKKTASSWNKKLKAAGFEDIESDSYVKNDSIKKQEFKVDYERIAYFKRCEEYLHKATFKDTVDKFIFENHCAGKSNRQIVELLESGGYKPLKHTAVDARLLKILKEADIEPIVFKI